MKTPAIMHTPSFFSVLFVEEARPILVMSTDSRYDKCIEFYKNEDYEGLYEFLSPDKMVEKVSAGELVVEGNEILYKGEPVHNVVVGRIFECIEGNLPYGHLMNFLKNTLEGMSFDVLNELYLFLESNESMPIMADGSFLAYRVVDSEYMSKHRNPDGTQNRNMIGDVVETTRNKVNPNRNQTCAQGLHFCSYSYIPYYGYADSDRVMIVKIFPQDVIAIPNDYNNSKGRCCKYEVIAEVENYKRDNEDFENQAKSQAQSIAYDDDTPDFDDYDEVWEEEDVLDYIEGIIEDGEGKTPTNSNTEVNVSGETEHMVERIIQAQLHNNDVTTARRVSKSTKPYVNCKDVVDFAKDLGFTVVEKDVVSLTEISHAQ
jgi:hypothetical protein